MGIETHALKLVQREFPEAFVETATVFEHPYFDPINRSRSPKIAIVEATPFYKVKNDNFKSGMDLFKLKFVSTINHYVSLGFDRIHIVFDNGSPTAKYDTHVERYKRVSRYPKTKESVVSVSSISDLDKWTAAVSKIQTNSGCFTMSTMTDFSIISEKEWDSHVSNSRVVSDIIAYITHSFLYGRTSKTGEEVELDDTRAGLYGHAFNPFGSKEKRINIPKDVKVFIHLGKTYLKRGPSRPNTNRDYDYWEITSDHFCNPNEILSRESALRMKEGELTCAILCKNEILRTIFENRKDYETFLADDAPTPSEKKKFDTGCILVDTVDGDLLPILAWVSIISEALLSEMGASDNFLKLHMKDMRPNFLLWLRQSGKNAYRKAPKLKNTKQNDALNAMYERPDDSLAPSFSEQSKRDWLDARSSSKLSFTKDQFYDKPDARANSTFDRVSFLKENLNSSKPIPHNANRIYDRFAYCDDIAGKATFDDADSEESIFLGMMSGFQDVAKASKSGIYRNRAYPTGIFVDILTLADSMRYSHPVFSKMKSPVAALTAVLSLCGNDYVKQALPGVTSSVDNEGSTVFYVALKNNISKFADAFEFEISSVLYNRAHPDVSFKIRCSYPTDDFKEYIMDVYATKYLDPNRISNVLRDKIDREITKKYGSRESLRTFCEKSLKSRGGKSVLRRPTNDDEICVGPEETVDGMANEKERALALETLRAHVGSGRNRMLTNDEISGLFARLSWYLEYIVTSIANDGIFPDPLAKTMGGVPIFGWTFAKKDSDVGDEMHASGESVYDNNVTILKTNHVANRDVISNEPWYNVSPQMLYYGQHKADFYQDVDPSRRESVYENDFNPFAKKDRANATKNKLDELFGISPKKYGEYTILDCDLVLEQPTASRVDDDGAENLLDVLEQLDDNPRTSSVPSFETIFGVVPRDVNGDSIERDVEPIPVNSEQAVNDDSVLLVLFEPTEQRRSDANDTPSPQKTALIGDKKTLAESIKKRSVVPESQPPTSPSPPTSSSPTTITKQPAVSESQAKSKARSVGLSTTNRNPARKTTTVSAPKRSREHDDHTKDDESRKKHRKK